MKFNVKSGSFMVFFGFSGRLWGEGGGRVSILGRNAMGVWLMRYGKAVKEG